MSRTARASVGGICCNLVNRANGRAEVFRKEADYAAFVDLTPEDVMVDQGYRGHGYAGSAIVHVVRTIPKRATRAFRRLLRRRAAIEPTIGHLKSDNRMNRNYLTGQAGDRINAVLSAAGYNLRKLLRWLVFAPLFWLMGWLTARLAVEIALRHTPRRGACPGFAPAVI